ncbi:MAG: potassium channel family protein [Candidatus Latescibacterota bacterium]|nr:potassium channel family protein [Candidatus Latescibacterota bacterium]
MAKARPVIGSAVLLNFACATAYHRAPKGPDGPLGFSSRAGFEANFLDFFSCVYYSVVTFTTLGYGDITP